MVETHYKKGIKLDWWTPRIQTFGFGIVWSNEKYIHFNLFNVALAIGKVEV